MTPIAGSCGAGQGWWSHWTSHIDPFTWYQSSKYLVFQAFFVALLEQEKLLSSVSERFCLVYNDLIQNQTWRPLERLETPKHLLPLNPPLANLKFANNL